jgi:hypothetical protein
LEEGAARVFEALKRDLETKKGAHSVRP